MHEGLIATFYGCSAMATLDAVVWLGGSAPNIFRMGQSDDRDGVNGLAITVQPGD